jgi:hypothetical protein
VFSVAYAALDAGENSEGHGADNFRLHSKFLGSHSGFLDERFAHGIFSTTGQRNDFFQDISPLMPASPWTRRMLYYAS